MSLPALATLEDLEARMGDVSDGTRARAKLDDASALIRLEGGTTWTTGGALDDDRPDILKVICCKVAERALSNPEGLTGQAIGDYSEQRANASTDVYLTASERRLIGRCVGTGWAGIGTISTSRGPLETAAVLDEWGDETLNWYGSV